MAQRPDAPSGRSAVAPPEAHLGPELDLRRPEPRRAPAPKPPVADEAPLELAVDPRALVLERTAPAAVEPPPPSTPLVAAEPDVATDARLLADYGAPPRHWALSPFYAWRVLRRRRALKAALAGRREEASRAAGQVEDALVAFAERARPAAEHVAEYAGALAALRAAEDVLRSRDKVLAADQDAHGARLAQVDARLAALEGELAHAAGEERSAAAELAAAQEALAREEARLKRADAELRAAQKGAG